ncbi:MAG: ABC transporter ATP-binding protein, partial [Mycobacteriales bacterium]
LPAGVTVADLPVPAERDGPGRALLLTEEPAGPLHQLTGWLLEHGHPLAGLTVDRPSLEDVYLELTAERYT